MNWKLTLLAHFDIPYVLPQLGHLTYDFSLTQSRYNDQIFLRSDHPLFGSLDAAIRSGTRSVEGPAEAL